MLRITNQGDEEDQQTSCTLANAHNLKVVKSLLMENVADVQFAEVDNIVRGAVHGKPCLAIFINGTWL